MKFRFRALVLALVMASSPVLCNVLRMDRGVCSAIEGEDDEGGDDEGGDGNEAVVVKNDEDSRGKLAVKKIKIRNDQVETPESPENQTSVLAKVLTCTKKITLGLAAMSFPVVLFADKIPGVKGVGAMNYKLKRGTVDDGSNDTVGRGLVNLILSIAGVAFAVVGFGLELAGF
ncbi:MAG: hypothetical protein LBK29_02030 [Oscillospiraceae bacterium]|jgi:hypothetical protein|nr:hypothetical protein [Oscillospiraceae bacterium]